MGSPAAKTLIHGQFRITTERGIWFKDTQYAPFAMATFNPAYVLRQEGETFTATRQILIDDIAEALRRCNMTSQSTREVREMDEPPQLTLF